MANVESPTVSSSAPERRALVSYLTNLRGSIVTVQVADGTNYEGVYSSFSFEEQNHTLRQAQKTQPRGPMRNTNPFVPELKIDATQLVSITPVQAVAKKSKGFATDTEISGHSSFGKERALVSYFAQDVEQHELELLEEGSVDKWDQFATHAKMQGSRKSKEFNFNDYSTTIDPEFYKKHEKLAATIANEISANYNHDQDLEDEDNSCVARVERSPEVRVTAFATPTDKYVPPFRRAAMALSVAEPNKSPSPSPSARPSKSSSSSTTPSAATTTVTATATATTTSSTASTTSTAATASTADSASATDATAADNSTSSSSKFKFNPNARSFALDPFAPEFVPTEPAAEPVAIHVESNQGTFAMNGQSEAQMAQGRFPFQEGYPRMSPALLPPEASLYPMMAQQFPFPPQFPPQFAPQFSSPQFQPQTPPQFPVQSPQFMYGSPQFSPQPFPNMQLPFQARPGSPSQGPAQRFPNGAPMRQILPRPQGGFGANVRPFPQGGA